MVRQVYCWDLVFRERGNRTVTYGTPFSRMITPLARLPAPKQ